MLNRPFSSTNVNILDERTQNTIPTTLCGQNVLVSQEQHQKIFNTLTTFIGANPYFYPSMPQQNFSNPNVVTFTFGRPQTNYPQYTQYQQIMQQPIQQPMQQSIQQPFSCYSWAPNNQIGNNGMPNLNQMQQRNALDLLQLQHQLGNCPPYQLKFHLDNQTSTSDLPTKPKERAELKNLASLIMSKWPCWLQEPTSRENPKKLTLRVKTAELEGSILDNLEDPNNKNVTEDAKNCETDEDPKKKKVEFLEEQQQNVQNAQTQAHVCCSCCKCEKTDDKTPKKSKRGKRKSRVRKKEDEEYTTDSQYTDEDDEDKRMDSKKWNFSDLNSFVDHLSYDLYDSEASFQNQLLGVIEMAKINTRNRIKLQCFCNRFNNLKLLQEAIDYALDCTQNLQDKWEQILLTFENRCECLCAIPEDGCRASIYKTAEDLLISLSNCYEMVEQLDGKAREYNEEAKKDPFYAFCEIMASNLRLLEKLALHVQKAETYLNFNKRIQDRIKHKCFCNHQIY